MILNHRLSHPTSKIDGPNWRLRHRWSKINLWKRRTREEVFSHTTGDAFPYSFRSTRYFTNNTDWTMGSQNDLVYKSDRNISRSLNCFFMWNNSIYIKRIRKDLRLLLLSKCLYLLPRFPVDQNPSVKLSERDSTVLLLNRSSQT